MTPKELPLAASSDLRLRPSASGYDAVLTAALAAWKWHGTEYVVRDDEWAEQTGVLGAVDIPELRRVEIVLQTDFAESVWDALTVLDVDPLWHVCAVVPLSAMGKAHEALRDTGCDIQPWWTASDGSVAFGSVELA